MYQDSHTLIIRIRPLPDPQMIGQCVYQSAFEVPVARVHHHSGRLVYHQHILVFIYDIQRNVLRQYLHSSAAVWHHETDDIPRTDYIIRFHHLLPHVYIAFLDGQLYPVTGSVLHMLGHILVYTHRSLSHIHIQAEMFKEFV